MMKVKLFSALLFLVSIAAIAQSTANSIEEAKIIATKENKKIAVEFYADWCIYCKRFDKKTLTENSIVQSLNDYIWVKINAEKSTEDFVIKNNSKSYPQFYILNNKGDILKKEKGMMNVSEFKEFLHLK